ncbi:hypothetical protein HMN09_00461300 [Mycena chlorophos]|uniref:Cytochrome P450 n=1 Tax=Mycena chlorophos TaxID=658473 RepID=A0A8H6TIE8_MYCCL|nr:hypothetical protein HMN09_00461300 [Mycena chlorophos]
MDMAPEQLAVCAGIAGLANHLYFKNNEPKTGHWPLLGLGLQSVALTAVCTTLTPANLLYTTAVFLGSLTTSIVVYRLSPWHPLAQYPGPLLARVTKMWGLYTQLSTRKHKILKRLHEQYGDFVRIGPNDISIGNADAIKTVLGAGGFQKGHYYEVFTDPDLNQPNVFNMRGDAHAARRRIWNRGMGPEAMKSFEIPMAEHIKTMMGHLDRLSKEKKAANMSEWFTYFSFDFMGDMAFGGDFGKLKEGGDKDKTFPMLQIGIRGVATLTQVPWFAETFNAIPGVKGMVRDTFDFARKRADQRMKDGPAEIKDLWYHLMDEEGVEKVKLGQDEVLADGIMAVTAGSDTVATALTTFCWMMVKYPEAAARVRAEIDSIYPDGTNIFECDRHDELKFTNACIQETLRLYPPVPSNGARKIPPGPPRLVAGKVFPQNTQLYIPPYVIHRDERNFAPAPNSFDPDRWLRNGSGKGDVLNQMAFLAFSYGAANCVAKKLALNELMMVSTALMKRYEFSFSPLGTPKQTTEWDDSIDEYHITGVGKLMLDVKIR